MKSRMMTDFVPAGWLGRPLHVVEEVDSTNSRLALLAQEGAPEGTAVFADCQTRGRGRLGRVWQSPPGRNLYVSVLLKPDIPAGDAPQITLVTGVAVTEALSGICPGAAVKWPNDVLIGGRKACGILTEMRTRGGRVEYVIVGIGINVNVKREEFPEDLREIATSLREEAGREIDRVDLVKTLFTLLETWYDRHRRTGFAAVRERWLALSGILGKTVTVRNGGKEVEGTVFDLDSSGALLILDREGRREAVYAGDISLAGENLCC